ncbi:MAG: UbiA-like polyprenyltransferase [Dehalococcoidia bacterium]
MSGAVVSAVRWEQVWRKAVLFAQSIKIEHSIFALPFAYLTLFLVADGLPSGANFGWITLAMIGARTVGMASNRIIDAEIDARNPRTADRHLPTGLLRHREMFLFTAVAAALFLGAVYQLSSWAQYLWPAALAAVVFYPYLKRFTWACHLGLGMVYFLVPTGVWIAVTNDLTIGAVLLGIGAGFWVAGFDTIYGVLDIDFDRREGIHSIPARFGIVRGLLAAKAFHLTTVAFITAAGPVLHVGFLYYMGTAAFLGLILYEHRLVSAQDMSRASVAFFNLNGIIGVVFFLFVMADVLVT